jgi:hypothetical protein
MPNDWTPTEADALPWGKAVAQLAEWVGIYPAGTIVELTPDGDYVGLLAYFQIREGAE